MKQHEHNTGQSDKAARNSYRRPAWRRQIMSGMVAVIVGATALAGTSLASDVSSWHGARHGHDMHGPSDPAATKKQLVDMVEHILADGTPEQKAKVTEIAQAAIDDLHSIRGQLRQAHASRAKLLTQAVIDRPALDQLRAAQMHGLDAASKRIVLAMADAADVLTPEQRVKLSEQLVKAMH